MRFLLPALSLVLATGALAQPCTTSWTTAQDGIWSDDANWSDGAPEAGDTACIEQPGTYTVTLDRDQELAGLIVGGSSGTQTLVLDRRIEPLGSGTIGENGAVEIGTLGLRDVTGTLRVEGTLVAREGTGFLTLGGTLNVTTSGTLRVRTGINSVQIGSLPPGAPSRIVLRGTLQFAPEGNVARRTTIDGALDLNGGTIVLPDGEVLVRGEGRWRGGTFDVADGGSLRVFGIDQTRGTYELSGTFSGAPGGNVEFTLNAQLAAVAEGATFALGGAGLQIRGDVPPTTLRSGGFTNTGLLSFAGRVDRLAQAVLQNEGTVRIATNLQLDEGAVLRNTASGTVDLVGEGDIGTDGSGRLVNEGLLVSSGTGRSTLSRTLRSELGSEIRAEAGAEIQLDPPGSASVPDGVQLSGSGTVRLTSTQFQPELFIEGTLSPGAEAEPIATLRTQDWLVFSTVAGNPQLVVDVGANGASDLIEHTRNGSPVPGSVQLAGALVVRVAEGYTPQIGDTFTILRTTNTTNDILGDFTQVVALGAPDGIAFVAERNGDNSEILLRAVEAAPGGPIAVSETDPVGGGVRRLILTGPGAVGVSAARLECTDCLDASGFGTIAGVVSGDASLREVRFDLTSPRAWGFYDLVLVQPGLNDMRVPVTVRPYVSWIVAETDNDLGMRIRPATAPGQIHNYSWYDFTSVSNDNRGAAPFLSWQRPRPENTSMILATSHGAGASRSIRIYNSLTASDPDEPAFAFARVPPEGFGLPETGIEVGLRIDPEAVLFPEQMPTGPDDDRLPFGDGEPLAIVSTNNMTLARAIGVLETALRSTNDAALTTYLGALDAANPDIVTDAIQTALGGGARRYVQGLDALLSRFVDEADATVSAPAGLAEGAEQAFDDAVRAAVRAYSDESDAALRDGQNAIGAVADLQQAEFDALGIDLVVVDEDFPALAELEGLLGSASARTSAPGSCTGRNIFYCTPGGLKRSCPPSSGPADPNDKQTEDELRCEFESVMIDGEETFRCARTFLPLDRAAGPVEFTVRFENLPEALAPAEFVTITDVLDPRLDPNTLEVLSTSDDSTFSVTTQGQEVTFRFTGIDLPPNVNPPQGEGYVTFRVSPRTPLESGDTIENEASIVFDFNPDIVTNTVRYEVRQTSDLGTVVEAPEEAQEGQPFVFDVRAFNFVGDLAEETMLTISTGGAAVASAIPSAGTCTVGATVECDLGDIPTDETVTVTVTLDDPPRGVYTLASMVSSPGFDPFTPNDTDAVSAGVVGVSVEDETGIPREVRLANARPNPARGSTALRWGLPTAAPVDLRVYDLRGREVAVLAEGEVRAAGWHETVWRPDLASGIYVVRLMAGDEIRARKLAVVR
ncbi:MAG: T9SS type A sorting domain-containing protein [Bacteroidota bacterium]